MIIKSSFTPAWWLASPHLQTMWGTLLRKQPSIHLKREQFELPDGDFLDLDWIHATDVGANAPLIIVLHGLGGSINSHYAKSIMAEIDQQRWHGVFIHYRGCSGRPNLKTKSYHSGFTEDVRYVADKLKKRYPHSPIAVVGYSLGANILLKWLSETGRDNPIYTAVAVSVPFDLAKAANRMLEGFSRLYQWYMLKELHDQLENKFKEVPMPIDLSQLRHYKTFWEFDTHITAPIFGFKNAAEYYAKTSSRQYLRDIRIPTLLIHASDDPFMSPEVIPTENELSEVVTLELSEYGGHVGFISGSIPGNPEYWLDQRIIEYLSAEFNKTIE